MLLLPIRYFSLNGYLLLNYLIHIYFHFLLMFLKHYMHHLHLYNSSNMLLVGMLDILLMLLLIHIFRLTSFLLFVNYHLLFQLQLLLSMKMFDYNLHYLLLLVLNYFHLHILLQILLPIFLLILCPILHLHILCYFHL